ncbi:glycosyltransferase family A protein, partial [Escherichia coli]
SRLFNSLILQTDKDFEWIIIDDGSIDATAVLVEDFRKKCDFDLIYCYQENNGKPMALNAGVKACRGDYIFIVDSDDALTPDAIKLIKESIHDCLSEKESFSGVGFRKAYIKGGIIGNDLNNSSEHIYYLNATEISNLINGDVAYCFKKESLVKNPFPRIEDEKFV